MVTTNEKDSGLPLEVSRAIAELRRTIVASVLGRKHGFDDAGELARIEMYDSESLDDYAARLLVTYNKRDDNKSLLAGPSEGRVQEGVSSLASKSIWRRVLRFLTFGTYR